MRCPAGLGHAGPALDARAPPLRVKGGALQHRWRGFYACSDAMKLARGTRVCSLPRPVLRTELRVFVSVYLVSKIACVYNYQKQGKGSIYTNPLCPGLALRRCTSATVRTVCGPSSPSTRTRRSGWTHSSSRSQRTSTSWYSGRGQSGNTSFLFQWNGKDMNFPTPKA